MTLSKNQIKKERMKELIWYICENYNQQLYETKLWKLVFFCDSDYYEKYQTTLTSVPYIKNNHGPTPSYQITKKALEELAEGRFIVKSDSGTYVGIKEYPLKNLTPQQIDAIKSTCDKYFKLTTDQICTLAHRDPVYLAAEKHNDILDFSFVAYRDDGSHEEDDKDVEIPKKISFNKKATDNLFKLVMA